MEKKVLVHDGQAEYNQYVGSLNYQVKILNATAEIVKELLKDTTIQVTDTLVYGGVPTIQSVIDNYILSQAQHYQSYLRQFYDAQMADLKLPVLMLTKNNVSADFYDLKQYIKFEKGIFTADIDKIDRTGFNTYIDESLYNDFVTYITASNSLAKRFKNYTAEFLRALDVPFQESGKIDGMKSIDRIGHLCKNIKL